MQVLLEAEDEFEITIEDKSAVLIKTVGEAISSIELWVKQKAAKQKEKSNA